MEQFNMEYVLLVLYPYIEMTIMSLLNYLYSLFLTKDDYLPFYCLR